MQMTMAIGPLTKVALMLTVSDKGTGGKPAAAHIQFEFIYGIGAQGLSAFEADLTGLSAGTRKKIRVAAHEMQTYFDHLRCPLLETLGTTPPLDFDIEVLSARPATDRELVHALANRDGSGCDCNCGCGCQAMQ